MNNLLQSVQLAISSGNQPEAMAEIQSVVDYIKEHRSEKLYKEWDEEAIFLYVAYHLAKNTIIISRNQEGALNGCCTWYNCNKEDVDDIIDKWQPDNPGGDSIYIGITIADNTEIFKRGAVEIIKRNPDIAQKRILMHRLYKDGEHIREKNISIFKKILGIK